MLCEAGDVPPQHILLCVTLEVISLGTLTAAAATLQEFWPSLHDIWATLPLQSSVGAGNLINLCIRCAGPSHLHTSPLSEKASISTLGSQEPGLMGAFPPGQEPANSQLVKVLVALKDPDSAHNGIQGKR